MGNVIVKPGSGADLDLVTAAAGDVLKGKVIVDPEGDPVEGTLELTGNITAADIRKGKKGYSTDPKKPIAGTMAEQAAQTIKPGTANKTIAANRYLTGVQTIQGDKNLLAKNIIKGVTIFGVAGSAVYAGDTPGYFLEPPKEYEELTGGWGALSDSDYETTFTRGTTSYDIALDELKDTIMLGYYCARFYAKNAIDLTNYRYIYVDYEVNVKISIKGGEERSVRIVASVRQSNSHLTASNAIGEITYAKNGTYSGTLKVDVSNLTEEEYVRVGIAPGGSSIGTGASGANFNGTKLKIKAVRYDKIQ